MMGQGPLWNAGHGKKMPQKSEAYSAYFGACEQEPQDQQKLEDQQELGWGGERQGHDGGREEHGGWREHGRREQRKGKEQKP